MEEGEKKNKQLVEAALFMAAEPITVEELSRLANCPIEETRMALNELSLDLDERKSSIEVKFEPTGARLAVRKEFDEFVKNFSTIPELNKSTLKTLALISFKQPIRQSEVIRIRNNKAYEHIKTLEEKGFIRREEVGKTYMVYTTKKFIDYFGAQNQPPVQVQSEKKQSA